MQNSQAKFELVKGEPLEEDKMDIKAIPNIEVLSSKVVEFIEFYDDPKTKKLRETNNGAYLNLLYDRFEILPLSMIKLLSEPDKQARAQNLEKIILLLEKLAEVKLGKRNLETTRDEFLEENNEKYFYPAFGGKDALVKFAEEQGEDVSNFKK